MEPTTIITIVVALVGAVVGALLGGGGALVIVGRTLKTVNANVPLQTAIEGLITSAPPQVLSNIQAGANDLAILAEIVRKITDGLPNDSAVTDADTAKLTKIIDKAPVTPTVTVTQTFAAPPVPPAEAVPIGPAG